MTDKKMRIGFMGTPDFALAALKTLDATPHDIVCVYTQPPRPKGRGHKTQKSPVHEFAETKNIPVFTPKSLKSRDIQDEFKAHDLDLAIVAAYGLLLPKPILESPKHGCVNIHASLLPRWRGASPIQQAIWHGDTETGITLMQMDEGLDTGPIISMQSTPITDTTTCVTLYTELCKIQEVLVAAFLENLVHTGQVKSTPQDDSLATHAPLLTKNDGRVNWTQTAEQIDRQIRALNPWPGVWTMNNHQRFKILRAQISDTSIDQPGTILSKTGHVACAHNTTLQLLTIQPPGKKAMDFASAVNGGYISVGDQFL